MLDPFRASAGYSRRAFRNKFLHSSIVVLMTFAFLPLLAFSQPAFAGMHIDGKPKVSFFAVGSPGFLDIEGVTSDLVATDDGTTLVFAVKLDTISTGIDLRDEHMKSKFMLTQTYPNATLSLPKASIAWPTETGKSISATITAPFSAHGQTHDVPVEYTVKKSKTGQHITAKFPFDIVNFGIDVPSYLGITVDTAMHAEVAFDLVDTP